MMLVPGPLLFAACYLGICECAYRMFNAWRAQRAGGAAGLSALRLVGGVPM